MSVEEDAKYIREKIMRKPDLVINRIPKNTLDKWHEFANQDDFCQDYGNALKFLLDFYYGLIPTGVEHLELRINALETEVEGLKAKTSEVKEEKKTEKVMMDGTRISQ